MKFFQVYFPFNDLLREFCSTFIYVICVCVLFTADTDESMVMVNKPKDTIWLGALLPLYNANLNVNRQNGIILYEALRYAIASENNKKSLPYNWKFALRNVMSTVFTLNGAAKSREYFGNCYFSNVLFHIGPHYVGTTDMIDDFSETIHMPFISLSSTTEEREEQKNLEAEKEGYVRATFDYSYQVAIPDEYWYVALRDLILKFQWNFVATLHSREYWYKVILFQDMLLEEGVCEWDFGFSDNYDDSYLTKKISELASDKRVKVLVLFTSQRDTRRVLKAFKALNLRYRFVLLFTQTMLDSDIARGYEEFVHGALSLRPLDEEDVDFRD